ncbi:heme o synthase [bacterium]|nr:heme o synthase [bacterium]
MTDLSINQTEQAASVTAGVLDYVALLKPRVMSLVVFTGLVGLVMAPGLINPVTAVIALIAIALGAGASGAINMWYDADIDAVMARTASRPIPAGRVQRSEALTFGVVVALLSVIVMGSLVNWLAAALLALTISFYVFVYTMWLKRRTPQNIVVGGAAGALPPMIGWAAVTGEVSLLPFMMFAIIFFWTPPHFWALALYRSGDYAKAGVPMLPVARGDRETRRQIMLYSLLLAPLAVTPWLWGGASVFYGLAAAVLGVAFLGLAAAVWRRDFARAEADGHREEKRLFGYSILYLFLIFALLLADHVLGWAPGS